MQIGKLFSLSIVIGRGRLSIGSAAGQVKLVDQIGLPLVEVDSTGVYLEKGHASLNGLQQRAG